MSDTNWFTEKLDNLEKKMEQLEIDKEFFKKEYIQINEKYLKVLEMLQQTQTKVKQYKEVLEWYANPKTYKRAGNGEYVIMMDKGWNARQVLEVGEVRKMNDKTRLQEIKENFTLMNNFAELCQTGTCTLSLKDYDWLISQLERLQKENET